MKINEKPKIIGFDADDTLWHNEQMFRDVEEWLSQCLTQYEVPHRILQELYKTEMKNLPLYGYGIKGFILSLIEVSLHVSNGQVSKQLLKEIIDTGKKMLDAPVEILPEVHDTLAELSAHFRLVVVTKGDLLDQKRKLDKSGLIDFFHHIEIVSEKKSENYKSLFRRLDCPAERFVMVGNSLKSDVLPAIESGAIGVHIPYHTTWQHEQVEASLLDRYTYFSITHFSHLKEILIGTSYF